MSTFALRVEPASLRRASWFWMFVLEVYWIMLVLVAKPAPSAASIQLLIVVIGLATAMAAWRAGTALADGARVLGTLRTPSALWHAWLRKIAVTLATRWAMAVAAGTVAVMQHGSSWMWSGPVALYSAVLLVALVASIAQHGLWHWAWTWLIAAGLAIVAALTHWQGLDAWMEAEPPGHLALACVCVGATVAVLAHWRTPPPPRPGARPRRPFNPLRGVINYARRFTLLTAPAAESSASKGRGSTLVLVALPLTYMLFTRVMMHARWGDPVGVSYLFNLLLMMAFVQASVVCKDLHWRRLLAPQGFRRGGIGWHLIVSTLEVNLGVAALLAAIAAALLISLSWAGMDIDVPAIARWALPYGVVAAEYLMAICVAVAMRALRGQMILFVAALLMVATAALWLAMRIGINPYQNFLVIGPAYLASLVIIGATATVLANRIWTMQRLLPYLSTRASTEDDLASRGRWFPWPGRPY